MLQGLRVSRRRRARAERRARDRRSWPKASTSSPRSPVVDTTSSEVGTTFDQDWVDERALAPLRLLRSAGAGAGHRSKAATATAPRERRTMSFGSSFDENAFQLDGVNVTDNYFSEGFSEPNPDAIDEVEVLSLGAPGRVRQPDGRRLQHRHQAGHQPVPRRRQRFLPVERAHVQQHEGREVPERQVRRCLRRRSGRPLPVDARRILRGHGAARRSDRARQAVVLRVVRAPEGPVHARRRELGASGQRDRHHEGSDSRERHVADVRRPSGSSATSISTSRPSDTGYSFNETPSTAWTRTQKAPTPGVAYTATLSNKTLLDVRYSGFYGSVTGYPSDPSRAARPAPHLRR